MLKTQKYARRPFYVDAIQVTEENMEEVAEWCMGNIQVTEKGEGEEERYIKVRVHRPNTERQTMAYPGDWILYAGTGFKVYTDRAFQKSFEKKTKFSKAEADKAGIKPPIEKPQRKPSPATVAARHKAINGESKPLTVEEEQEKFAEDLLREEGLG